MPWYPANPEQRTADLDRLVFLHRLIRSQAIGWQHAIDEAIALHERIGAEDQQQRESSPPPWRDDRFFSTMPLTSGW